MGPDSHAPFGDRLGRGTSQTAMAPDTSPYTPASAATTIDPMTSATMPGRASDPTAPSMRMSWWQRRRSHSAEPVSNAAG